ncbi:hypothetical protein KC460_04105 [Candidatus Dependentiae bacterium]|nr:hypothetical protein [Candidatus Dependentiae bacterium]
MNIIKKFLLLLAFAASITPLTHADWTREFIFDNILAAVGTYGFVKSTYQSIQYLRTFYKNYMSYNEFKVGIIPVMSYLTSETHKVEKIDKQDPQVLNEKNVIYDAVAELFGANSDQPTNNTMLWVYGKKTYAPLVLSGVFAIKSSVYAYLIYKTLKLR